MERKHTHDYFLTAGECDATGHMPVQLLVSRVIEVATEHANSLNIGYANLQPRGIAWVLSRVSIEMDTWPGINSAYSLTTWIEGWTRFYSDRCFEVRDGEGRVIGHVRTVWAAIDIEKRSPAQLDGIANDEMVNHELTCPVAKQRKIAPVTLDTATNVMDYTFRYADLDFNRHVNSVRYVDHILNLWPLDFYDAWQLRVFEIAYVHECRFGETVAIAAVEEPAEDGSATARVDMLRDGARTVAARLVWRKRES